MKKIFVDLEMNRIARQYTELRKKCRNEIIEIGAVKLNEQNEIIDTFKLYVKPAFNDTIAGNIRRLTGITDEMVNGAPAFADAMMQFISWCGEECEVYSWSYTDLWQIKIEYEIKDIPMPEEFKTLMSHWNDYQKQFGDAVRIKEALSLEKAVLISGIEPSGRAHDGLTDAMDTAKIFISSQKGLDFGKVRRLLDELFSEHTFSMGDMFDFGALQLAG